MLVLLGAEPLERREQQARGARPDARAGVGDLDAQLVAVRRSHETATVPPSRLYLIAFDTRLSRTCLSRCRSASTWSSRIRAASRRRWMSALRRPAAASSVERRRASSSLTRTGSGRELEVAGLDAGDVEHLVDQLEQVAAALDDLPTDSLVGSVEVVESRAAGANPSTAFSGVRSSWLMRERNSLFDRFAASAPSLA